MKYFTDEEIWMMSQEYSTSCRLRNIMLNMFNPENYNNVGLLGVFTHSDARHLKLLDKIFKMHINYINGEQIFKDFKGFFTYSGI